MGPGLWFSRSTLVRSLCLLDMVFYLAVLVWCVPLLLAALAKVWRPSISSLLGVHILSFRAVPGREVWEGAEAP